MAITINTPLVVDGPEGSVRRVVGLLTGDISYPAGGLGLPFPMASIGAKELAAMAVFQPTSGYVFEWNGSVTAPTVKVYRQTNISGPLGNLGTGTNLTASSAMFVAYVKS